MSLVKLKDIAFQEKIYDQGETCLILFSRKGCHVCQEVGPIIEELSEKYVGKIGFYYVDVEEDKDLFKRLSLKGVPQILFFQDGIYNGKLAGIVKEEKITEKIREII